MAALPSGIDFFLVLIGVPDNPFDYSCEVTIWFLMRRPGLMPGGGFLFETLLLHLRLAGNDCGRGFGRCLGHSFGRSSGHSSGRRSLRG